MEKKKILYFINGSVPSDEEKEFAKKCKHKVCFRNIKFFSPEGCLEKCDFVLGEIPEKYLKAKIPVFGKKVEKEVEKEVENKTQNVGWQPNV